MATLKVTVHEARDLPIMDRTTGLADPYVVVKLDDMEHTTDIARRTRNPVWEHDIRFDTADLLVLQEDPLEIRVYDHDIISRDDIIGMVLLDCNSIIYRANPVVSGWFPLLDSDAGLHGDLRLTIRIKFHAAENPLAPALPVRNVRRLDPRVSERFWSPQGTAPDGSGDNSHNPSTDPQANEANNVFTVSPPAPGPNPTTQGSSSNLNNSAEQSSRCPLAEPYTTLGNSVTVNNSSASICLSGVGHPQQQRKRLLFSPQTVGARGTYKSPKQASSVSGGIHDTGTGVTALTNVSVHMVSSNLSITAPNGSANLKLGSSTLFSPYDSSLLLPGPPIVTAAAAAEKSTTTAMPPPLPSSSLFPFLVEQDLDPLRAARVDHPTLAAEEEGVFVFSVWRLDPAVFRVESTHSMMEELIVKADPEHVRFTNLRSSRSINDARVIQLFKLSGKVRRQLARKVVELQCNAVLGYVEEFDMEPNGIIVRAYGTPCLVSRVRYVDQRKMEALFRGKSRYIQSNMMEAYQAEFPRASLATAPPQPRTSLPPTFNMSPIVKSGGGPLNVSSAALTQATPSGPTSSANNLIAGNPMLPPSPSPPTLIASSDLMTTRDRLLPPPVSPLSTSAREPHNQASVVMSEVSTPYASLEPVRTTAIHSLGSVSEMHTSDSGVPPLSLEHETAAMEPTEAALASSLPGTHGTNFTAHQASQVNTALVNNVRGIPTFTAHGCMARSMDAATLLSSEALTPQKPIPFHGNLMRNNVTDTTAAAAAAASASAAGGGGGGPPARVIISLLTVKDLPAGSIHHIGGYICARSVKIVSRVKSRQIISQERDAWWMELREELRANARAFHCNTVLGYEEETQYHEDVVLLSLYGTAVMLDMSAASMRAGPEYLFRWQKERIVAKRNCSLLHIYEEPRRKRGHGLLASGVGDLLMHNVCSICHSKRVPDVVLAGCTLPVELNCEAPPRLVQVAVSKPKANVKGVELAMAVSQALPFIEFALHKQLIFNLRLQQLNACFSLRVSIVVGQDAIVGMLTGSGCRLEGLSVPRLPRVSVMDPQIARKESVVKLRDVIASRRRRRNHTHAGRSSSSRSSSSSSTSSSSSCSLKPPVSAQASAMTSAHGLLPLTAVAAAGRRSGKSVSDTRGLNSASVKASTATAAAQTCSMPSSTRTSSSPPSPSSSSSSCKRHKHDRRRRRRNHRRRRRHRRRGKSNTSSSSSSSSGDSLPFSSAKDVPWPSVVISESLHSSQIDPVAAEQTQKRRQHRRTRLLRVAGGGATSAEPQLSALSSSTSSSSRSSSSSTYSSSRSSPSIASLQSWLPTESSETDEDVYAPVDGWRTTSGGMRTKARDYVVKIDDVEEADMMLGMVDATNFEDGVLLTLPYVPGSANVFDWQERIVLDRRYSRASTFSFAGSGGSGVALQVSNATLGSTGGRSGAAGNNSAPGATVLAGRGAGQHPSDPPSAAAGGDSTGVGGVISGAGRMRLTTRLLNEYCADAKRAFVHRACRLAMRTGQPLRMRVVNLRVEMMFVPNCSDLQLRLEGCVMVASSLGTQKLRELEDRAFRVCMYYTMESLAGLWQYQQQQQYSSQAGQSNQGGSSAGGQRAAGATNGMTSNAAASGKGTPHLRWGTQAHTPSPLAGDSTSNHLANSLSIGSAAVTAVGTSQPITSQSPLLSTVPPQFAAYAAVYATQNQNVHATTSMNDAQIMSSVLATMDSASAYFDARRLFITSIAPFSLPYVQDITVPPLRVWSGVATAVSEDTAAPARHTSTYAEYHDSRSSRKTSLSRRWNTFIRAAGHSIKSLVDRATNGGTGDRRMQQQQRQWLSSSMTNPSVKVGGENDKSHTSIGDFSADPSAMTDATRDANYCNPAARLPKDVSQLQTLIPVVLFTSLDYVAGRSIVRYLGRLSQHFIREDYDTATSDDLSMFFQRAETEIMCVVQALVRLMGGNTLLKHRIVYHEICDSDGSGSAFLFATVTGDVVQVSDIEYGGKHAQHQPRQKDTIWRKTGKDAAAVYYSEDSDDAGSGEAISASAPAVPNVHGQGSTAQVWADSEKFHFES